MKPKTFGKYFDHTILNPDATLKDLQKACEEAKEIGAFSVCVNPGYVKETKEFLKGSDILVGAAIGFPLGATTIETKLFEAKEAIENGAGEIDYVVNVSRIKNKDWDYVKDEMERLTTMAHSVNTPIKVIFETCYLTKEEIVELAKIAKEVKPDFIKTSTGFGKDGAKIQDVELMADTVQGEVAIKASGGIRNLTCAKDMIKAGASRIGCSRSLDIVDDFKHASKYDPQLAALIDDEKEAESESVFS